MNTKSHKIQRPTLLGIIKAAAIATTVSAHAIDVPIADDAWVGSNTPSYNAGGDPRLIVSGVAATTRWSYLKFNVASFVPAGTKADDIDKAVIRLYPVTITTAGSISIFNVTGAWVEGKKANTAASAGELNWTNKPTNEATQETAVTLATTDADEFLSLDVTVLLKEWLGGPPVTQNFGILLKPSTGSLVNITFDSKENSTNAQQPTLDVTLVKKRIRPLGDLSMGTFKSGPTPDGLAP